MADFIIIKPSWAKILPPPPTTPSFLFYNVKLLHFSPGSGTSEMHNSCFSVAPSGVCFGCTHDSSHSCGVSAASYSFQCNIRTTLASTWSLSCQVLHVLVLLCTPRPCFTPRRGDLPARRSRTHPPIVPVFRCCFVGRVAPIPDSGRIIQPL